MVDREIGKLLIVDDKAESIDELEQLFKGDAQIFKAASSSEAISLSLRHEFALILMSSKLSGSDPFDTLVAIHQNHEVSHVPVIMLCDPPPDLAVLTQGYESGAIDVVARSIGNDLLHAKVEAFLKIDRQRREMKEAMTALKRLNQQNQLLLHCAGQGILGLDHNGSVLFANPIAADMLGNTVERLVGTHISECLALVDEDNQADWKESHLYATLKEGGSLHQKEIMFRRKDGTNFPVEYSSAAILEEGIGFSGGVLVFQDVTGRKLTEEKLTNIARADALTGLANQQGLHDFLARSIARAQRHDRIIAVLMLNLDNFKSINDRFGHDAGDQFLIGVSKRLRSIIRSGDLAARAGGDNFALVLDDIGQPEDAARVADKLIESLAKPYRLGLSEVSTSVSIGISVFPGAAGSPTGLQKAAESAMYHAKKENGNHFQFFAPDMKDRATAYSRIEKDLLQATNNADFVVHYHPQVDAASGNIVSMEALLRWPHDDLGIIPPSQFIPLAEKHGLMPRIGDFVLRTACDRIFQWKKSGKVLESMAVAVNISFRQLRGGEFFDIIRNVLKQTGLEPGFLEVELTESTIMNDPDSALPVLEKIHDLGVRIAIDDFGTGYTSLGYLKNMPIDTLKIDRSFICRIGQERHEEMVIKAIINFARTLGLRVVAEGVESRAQVAFLRENHCDLMQGYYFSRPLSAGAATHLLDDGLKNLDLGKAP